MEPKQRQQVLFVLLLVALAGMLAYHFWPAPAPGAAAASKGPGARTSGAAPAKGAESGAAAVPDVRLDALNARPAAPERTERNLFRFKPKAPPPPSPSAARPGAGGPGAAPAQPPVPAGPPPPPPITLKFIGIVESGGAEPKLAVLSDGRAVYQGREGDIIEGRYRIVRIGTESIEMSYLDGRGRQTIRLTGQ